MSKSSHANPERVLGRRCNNNSVDFSKVGGLSNHIKILRDLIIIPLLHNNVFLYHHIKAPRGVLFYGPPGTGKTLVAGALATEINREGVGKVTFYQRKGADVLDKWVGESEKKLRELFDNAAKNRPSIIFFDELDGLAPVRSPINDHVHCSVVTTLLALMDGLDAMPGVIVIGATNRIESVDPALRRPGRFDRELYFPLPSTEARKEILQVHTHNWRHKPSHQFLAYLAGITTGFCGSDLQALCAESMLCCMKRQYPNIQKSGASGRVKIEADEIKIDETDFLNAMKNLIPCSQKLGNRIRKLSPTMRPLLQRQLDAILIRLKMLWPHFFIQFHKYVLGTERYVGRVVLMGTNVQGINSHLVPAILQNFEHLPAHFVEVAPSLQKSISGARHSLPSILVIPRIDELWDLLEGTEQICLTTALEDIHAGLPMLLIVTCETELPLMAFFYNNTSMVMKVENPRNDEIEDFFLPQFFGEDHNSLAGILKATKCHNINNNGTDHSLPPPNTNSSKSSKNRSDKNQPNNSYCKQQYLSGGKVCKIKENSGKIRKSKSKTVLLFNREMNSNNNNNNKTNPFSMDPSHTESLFNVVCNGGIARLKCLSLILPKLLRRGIRSAIDRKMVASSRDQHPVTSCGGGGGGANQQKEDQLIQHLYGDSQDVDKQNIYHLWRRTTSTTAKDMPVAHLEILYDIITACINIHRECFEDVVKNLEHTLSDIEAVRLSEQITGDE